MWGVEGRFSDAALVEPNGSLRGDCLTAVAATLTTAVPMTVTIDGDALSTREDFQTPRTRRWRRFVCVEPEIELLPSSQE